MTVEMRSVVSAILSTALSFRSVSPQLYERLDREVYSSQIYIAADSGVDQCRWTYENPRAENHRSISITITNIVMSLLVRFVRQPILRVLHSGISLSSGDRIYEQAIHNHVIRPIWGIGREFEANIDLEHVEEARKHVVNLFLYRFREELDCLVYTLQVLWQLTRREAVAAVFTNTDSFAVRIAREALRVKKISSERELIPVETFG